MFIKRTTSMLLLGTLALLSAPNVVMAETDLNAPPTQEVVKERPTADPETDYAAWKQQLVQQSSPGSDSPSFTTSAYSNGKVYNDFLEYVVAGNGRFSIGTTGGNPSTSTDNYQRLIYGHPSPSTSYTTVVVDGSPSYYQPNVQQPVVDVAANRNTSEQRVNNVGIKQMISLQQNMNTKRADTVEIKYVVTNHDTRNHSFGMRIMMDTMLGNNDSAPFRVPGTGAVTKEREYSGSAIPEYYQVFDNLTNPTVIAQGTLKTNNNPPSKVQFTNWSGVYGQMWNYTVNPSRDNGDSAVNIIWNIATLAPGETREYVTYYGLADFSQDLRPPVAVSLTGASTVESTEQGYNPNPFTATAYLQNIGSATAINTKATINLPEGLRLVAGQNPTVSIGNLAVQGQRQLSWNIEIDPSKEDRNLAYSVTITGDNTETKTVSRNIFIPATVEAVKTPDISILPGQTDGNNGWYKTPVTITLGSNLPSGAKCQYRIITGSGAGEWIEYTGPFTPQQNGENTEGVITIEYRAVSPGGQTSETGSTELKLDYSKPSTNVSLNPAEPNGNDGWYTTAPTITLTGNDATSGVVKTEYRVITEDGVGEWIEYTGPFTPQHDRSCIIEYRTTDGAGNVGDAKQLPLKHDQTAPVTTIILNPSAPQNNNGWYNGPVTFELPATDATSGLAKTEYRIIKNDQPAEWTEYTGPVTVDQDCNCTIEYRSTDKAGNVEQTKSQQLKLDRTAPTLTVALPDKLLWPPNHKYVPINLTVNGSDDLSGIASIVLTSITSNESDEGLGDGNHTSDVIDAEIGTLDTTISVRAERSGLNKGRVYTVTYTATDFAGNVTTATATITVPHDMSEKKGR